MILQEIFPRQDISHEVTDTSSENLNNLYPKVSGLRLNYVVAPNIENSNSDLASNDADRVLLKFIRSISDLIITTGATARAENLKSSKFAPILILTKSERHLDIPALHDQSKQKVYLTQKLETSYPNSNAVAIGVVQSAIPEFCFSFNHLNGFKYAVLESGLTVAKDFAQAGHLTEIDLTVTGVSTQEQAQSEASIFLSKLGVTSPTMIQLLRFESTWFFRFGSL